MTNQELNRDIKRMYKNCTSLKNTALWFDGDLQKEFKRLYFADKKAEVLTLQSLKMMLTLNAKFKIIEPDQFYQLEDINLK